ncbi:hypothetical protein GDO86_014456 [Hymenochirus boettgeri]|uniref:RAD52 motif-containing protein 1 n=1 Tax=Hymenochirus boettgeri TaxID=247094 RepID=A0A8T2JNZ2_9PIPI|nr:hypothetical protein GDO86_014456 [Hymenochirus boettgeri]
MDPEIVSFTIPTESNKIVFVWNISALRSEEEIYFSLLQVFSQFGALYTLKIFPNAGDPGYYAVIKYYCARDARRAQEACDHKNLFQDSPLKLQNISGLDEDEGDPQEEIKQRYLCVLEVLIPAYGVSSRGVGVAEETLIKQKDPTDFLQKTGNLQKYAAQKALSDAFQKILLLVFENGKVAVEYVSPDDNTVDCLTEEELQGLIQVNDFTWTSFNPDGEEEILGELTFHEDALGAED